MSIDWTKVKTSSDKEADALQALTDAAKSKRDSLLTTTDWTQVGDSSQLTNEALRTYRQALRDVPQQAGYPGDIVWPENPLEDN